MLFNYCMWENIYNYIGAKKIEKNTYPDCIDVYTYKLYNYIGANKDCLKTIQILKV